MGKKPKTIFGEVAMPVLKPPRPELATNIPELEERICACGCKLKFKVVPTSTMRYASRRCDPKPETRGPYPPKKPKKIEEEIEAEMKKDSS